MGMLGSALRCRARMQPDPRKGDCIRGREAGLVLGPRRSSGTQDTDPDPSSCSGLLSCSPWASVHFPDSPGTGGTCGPQALVQRSPAETRGLAVRSPGLTQGTSV